MRAKQQSQGNILIGLVIGLVLGVMLAVSYPSLLGKAGIAATNTKQAAFTAQMRKLWEDHATWTRVYIIDTAAGLPNAQYSAARLLKNQEDLGNGIKAYYGDAAGNMLTSLLKTHISGAVDLIAAAKKGDTKAVAKANDAWYKNGEEIADFLAKANPNWPQATLRKMMADHLDLTKAEAVARLSKNYQADVDAYDKVHDHILMMSDALSSGIIAQFPEMFK